MCQVMMTTQEIARDDLEEAQLQVRRAQETRRRAVLAIQDHLQVVRLISARPTPPLDGFVAGAVMREAKLRDSIDRADRYLAGALGSVSSTWLPYVDLAYAEEMIAPHCSDMLQDWSHHRDTHLLKLHSLLLHMH